MMGQAGAIVRYAPGPSLPAGCRRIGLRPRNIGIEIFQAELQLVFVEAFGTTPEPIALQRLDDLAQPVDLGLRLCPLAVERRSQLADHPMQRIDVIRQGSEVYVHEPEFRADSG